MFITRVKSHLRIKTDSWFRGTDGQAEHRGFEDSENILYYIIMKDTSHSTLVLTHGRYDTNSEPQGKQWTLGNDVSMWFHPC